MATFSERFKKLRKQKGKTLEQIANDLETTRATLSRYENDKRVPDKNFIESAADYFDVSADYLLGRINYKYKLPPNAIPVNEETTTLIPVVGRVACGIPLLAEENIIGYRLVLKKTINGGTYFFLQAEGDSMINAGIVPGSFILIREQEEVENGEIAVVCFMDGFDAEATVKRIHRTDGKLVLQPESPNPQHKVQIVDKGRVEIVGKVVGIQTDL